MSIGSVIRPRLRAMLVRGEEPEWLRQHSRRSRVALACLSAPPWVTRSMFRDLETEARFRTAATGVLHVVDHIIPVIHPLVCGLTVPWNARVIDKNANARKGNKLHPAFQIELFEEPEQLELV